MEDLLRSLIRNGSKITHTWVRHRLTEKGFTNGQSWVIFELFSHWRKPKILCRQKWEKSSKAMVIQEDDHNGLHEEFLHRNSNSTASFLHPILLQEIMLLTNEWKRGTFSIPRFKGNSSYKKMDIDLQAKVSSNGKLTAWIMICFKSLLPFGKILMLISMNALNWLIIFNYGCFSEKKVKKSKSELNIWEDAQNGWFNPLDALFFLFLLPHDWAFINFVKYFYFQVLSGRLSFLLRYKLLYWQYLFHQELFLSFQFCDPHIFKIIQLLFLILRIAFAQYNVAWCLGMWR